VELHPPHPPHNHEDIDDGNSNSNTDTATAAATAVPPPSPRVRYALYKLYWAAGHPSRALRLMGSFAQRLEGEEGGAVMVAAGGGGGGKEGERQVCMYIYVYVCMYLCACVFMEGGRGVGRWRGRRGAVIVVFVVEWWECLAD
jgi:hypothetical protein